MAALSPVDPALVRACQRGEPGAVDELIRGTYADVYALCRRLLGDPADAADATQEVYLRVVRSVLAFRGDAAFTTWLHRVTVNVCLTALTRRAARALAGLPDDARQVVVLRDVQGLSTKETAELLGVTEGAVKVRLHRAHARLRELVEDP